jgi:ribonucleoside-diphosphate reductase alpha chain
LSGSFRTSFAENIFRQKYAQGKDDTWVALAARLVDDVCGTMGGTLEPILSKDTRDDLVKLITEMKFIPGGRYLYYAGRPLHAFNNCFLLAGEADTREEWGNLIKRASDCLMLGGGIGVDYSVFRPRGTKLNRTGGEACLPGDTVVYKDRKKSRRKNEITIDRLFKLQNTKPDKFKKMKLLSLDEDNGAFYRNHVEAVVYNGVKPVYRVTTSAGYTIEATPNHRFMNQERDYQQLDTFSVGDAIAVNGVQLPVGLVNERYQRFLCKRCSSRGVSRQGATCFYCREHLACPLCGGNVSRKAKQCRDCCDKAQIKPTALETTARSRKSCRAALRESCEMCGTSSGRLEVHHIDKNPLNNEPANLLCLCIRCHNDVHKVERKFGDPYSHKYLTFDTIASIEFVGEKPVYDLQMQAPNHNFVANGFVSHNSGPIPLMSAVNEYGRNVKQGGSRRSAIYASLNWRHGDVEEFLRVKNWHDMPVGKQKKRNGEPYTLADAKTEDFNFPAPLDMTNISVNYDNAWLELKGRNNAETFRQNVRQALSTGEPGFSFNFGSKETETLRNACTEVCSADDSDVCNLGSLNLGAFGDPREFSQAVDLASMFLVCGTMRADLPYQKVHDVRQKNRRLGLGLMGIHEWLLKRGKKYEVDDELRNWLGIYQLNSETAAKMLCGKLGISRPVAYRAIAPTGTIGILASTTTGIEPLYAVAFKRRYLAQGRWNYEYVVDATADHLIKTYGLKPEDIETAASLAEDPERRIKFQADIQDYVDMSISSTINLPAWGTDLNNGDKVLPFAKMLAKYAPRLRGFTCYPDGSRGGQPLTEVEYGEAVKHKGVVFAENDVCDITGKGGPCGL